MGASTSWKPHVLSRSVEGLLYHIHNLGLYPRYTYSYLLVSSIIHHALQTSHVLTPSFICYYNWNTQNMSHTFSAPLHLRSPVLLAPYQPRILASSRVFVLKLYDLSLWFEYIKVEQICLLKNGWSNKFDLLHNQWRTQEFCSWGVQQIQLMTEDRDLGAVVP